MVDAASIVFAERGENYCAVSKQREWRDGFGVRALRVRGESCGAARKYM